MLVKSEQARFCLYADYPVDTYDPSINEFPHERVFDLGNDWYLNPKEEGCRECWCIKTQGLLGVPVFLFAGHDY